MADVCPSQRLTQAPWCTAVVVAARAQVTSASDTTATVGGGSPGAGIAVGI